MALGLFFARTALQLLGKKKQQQAEQRAVAEQRAAQQAALAEQRAYDQANTRFVSAGDNAQSHIDGVMASAEKHKINPLTALGAVGAVGGQSFGGSSAQLGGINALPAFSMGSALADAGLSLLDNLAQKPDLNLQAEALRLQNQRLQKNLQKATLRPDVAGVYDRGQSGNNFVVGSNKGSPSDPIVNAARQLRSVDPLDPRRPLDNVATKSTGGTMRVDNPNLPFDLVSLTLDGDEPLQWYDYPSLIPAAVLGLGSEVAESISNPNWVPFSKRKPSRVPLSQAHKKMVLRGK